MKRALLVGAGAMGTAWARNLRECEKVDLVGWVDIVPGMAASKADENGIRLTYSGTDLREAIQTVNPDFVVDVTTPESHCEVTCCALQHRIPVLGEKPMAISMYEARKMVRTSEENRVLFMVSQSRRFEPGVAAFRRVIHDKIGRPEILNAEFYIGAHFGGFRDEMRSPLLLDMAIHTFDAARYISGCDPVSVYCDEFNPSWSWYKGASSANVIFEMSGGLRFCYFGSWCAEGKHTAWEANWRAVGPNGTILWDGINDPIGEVVVGTGGFHSEFREVSGNREHMDHHAIGGSLRHFLNALETGETPMGECTDNIKSLAMVFSALESASSGQRIKIKV